MKLGTRSLLWGAHAFFLHPLQVGWGWRQLWGFPWDVRLWIGFVFTMWDISSAIGWMAMAAKSM